ncbi:MAG: hypothetical protein K6C94_07250 [Candidatus Gastranaerophilales bacterium]|nr:hypothetical protein [Candidatus Gastranaerophilales bacterium]
MNFGYKILYFLTVCFPVVFLLLVTAKIFFFEKFSNKVFKIVILSVLAVFLLSLFFVTKGCYSFDNFYPLTLSETFYAYTSEIIFDACVFFVKACLVILPLLVLASVLYFVQTKDKKVFKKLIFSLLVFIPFIYLSYPCHLCLLKLNYQYAIERNKVIADKSVFPPVKAFNAAMAAFKIRNEIVRYQYETGNYEDFSSEEMQVMVNEYLKYMRMAAKIIGYQSSDICFLRDIEEFDVMQTVIDRIENRTEFPIPFKLDLLIAQKNYKDALKIIGRVAFDNYRYPHKSLYYIKIYTGLKQFDKAYQYYSRYEKAGPPKVIRTDDDAVKFYLDYKAGKRELARKDFSYLDYFINHRYTPEEYIKKIERVNY